MVGPRRVRCKPWRSSRNSLSGDLTSVGTSLHSNLPLPPLGMGSQRLFLIFICPGLHVGWSGGCLFAGLAKAGQGKFFPRLYDRTHLSHVTAASRVHPAGVVRSYGRIFWLFRSWLGYPVLIFLCCWGRDWTSLVLYCRLTSINFT